MEVISEQMPLTVDIVTSYSNGSNEDQKFISNLAQFFVTYLKEHSDIVEAQIIPQSEENIYANSTYQNANAASEDAKHMKQALLLALKYLLRLSQIEDVEVFKVSLITLFCAPLINAV